MSIDYTKHSDKRVNNPTMEHRDFFVAEERKPYDTLYPRDPSLDPQLVWKGKDEQDREDLAVPTVPIYIQEKIHPSAIIEDLRRNSPSPPAPSPPGGRGDVEQLDLFGDFNHMELAPGEDPFAAQIDFYSHKPEHQKSWTNRMILGDSLLVMNSLAEKEGLKGKVQCIYIDPPYGIKFGSNWQVSTRKRDVKDGKAEDQAREPEVIRAFRDTWALGIHSYLSYLRDRFQVAQELLTETGSIFVQIGDENVHLVRCVLDEVFGAENFVGQITFAKTSSALERTTALPSRFDHILWYAKELGSIKMRRLTTERADLLDAGFTLRYENGVVRPLTKEEKADIASLAPETIAKSEDLTKPGPGAKYEVQFRGRSYNSGGRWWGMQKQSLERLIGSGRVLASGNVLRALRLASDFGYAPLDSVWSDTSAAPDPSYVVQTHPVVVQRCILMATDPGDLVLDPTCGSGTTAHVAEQWGRRWITIDTSRVALALARTRLMSARFPYYLLADSPEGVKKEAEISGQVPPTYPIANDIKKGFVYKRVPHVTLKSIANNPEIEGIAAEYDAKIEEALEYINGPHCFGTKDKPGPYTHETMRQPESIGVQGQIVAARQANCVVAAQRYWELRRARREAIDKAIAKHADTELLFDQPYEDKKRVRVTGPFTVESLSPHRVLAADENEPAAEAEAARDDAAADFTTMVLENLRKAGVQNTKKGERLKFDTITPYAGAWVHAVGEYTDASGETRRAALSIGPEYNAVSPHQIKEAAKEAVKGVGFDVLVICGYAFDPHVSEEAKQYGSLTVLPAKITEDLRMGDDMLKKTGAGNLFMVFGEPDLEIHREEDKIVVELCGIDIYDPTTGVIRGGRAQVAEGYEQVDDATEDVACWFLDTNYNGESFFVRHAYFVGADKPYEKLAKTLRVQIDEAAWSTLYSTRSRPFDPPETGKIAVKVINHYGDEVLKVYSL